ncbi:MAG: crossover junction endodeoxyribonuclease RuvC [Alphaproteobacteria bacterium]|nr:crossover junction endodeoxyribonuclease RuvC [Alphaproteobacteria bacterium]
MRIIGIDPGLRHTGWGIIDVSGNSLSFVAAGRINPDADMPISLRLLAIADGISDIVNKYMPAEAAIEETFVNKNAKSALLLGQARGSAMLSLAQKGLPVTEYSANRIKQSVTGYGHADKKQIQTMVAILLPKMDKTVKLTPDGADALAAAITHAHHRGAR